MDVQGVYVQAPSGKTQTEVHFGLELLKRHIRHADVPPHVGIQTAVAYIDATLYIRPAGIQTAP